MDIPKFLSKEKECDARWNRNLRVPGIVNFVHRHPGIKLPGGMFSNDKMEFAARFYDHFHKHRVKTSGICRAT